MISFSVTGFIFTPFRSEPKIRTAMSRYSLMRGGPGSARNPSVRAGEHEHVVGHERAAAVHERCADRRLSPAALGNEGDDAVPGQHRRRVERLPPEAHHRERERVDEQVAEERFFAAVLERPRLDVPGVGADEELEQVGPSPIGGSVGQGCVLRPPVSL